MKFEMRNLCGSCFPKKREFQFESSPLSSFVGRKTSSSDSPQIIIVGAGIAGLACAVKLIENGLNNVKILEAENRVGGRIHTVPFGSGVVDMGAQWVHGERDNAIYEMVQDLNLLATTGNVYVSFECVRSNGESVPIELCERLKNILENVFSNERDLMAEYSGSFGKFLETRFFEILNEPQYKDIDHELAREFFDNFLKMESSESSLGLSEVSARGFTQYWTCDGDYLLNWKNKGYKEFIRVLTRSKTETDILGILKGNVILGCKVQKILWDQEDGLVSVICEDFEEPFIADNVVVTVSLGVLKKFANDMFVPPLPTQKLVAIDGLGYGDVFKVFIEFPYIFWPPDWTGFATLWRKEDLKELQKQDLLWLQEFYGFYPVNDQPHVLEAWAVGAAVPKMEKLPKRELMKHLTHLMRRFLINWNIPEPKSILATTWTSNQNFCGAYSFRTMHTESVSTSASALAKPVNTLLTILLGDTPEASEQDIDTSSTRVTIKPTLLFAGEATSSHYFSTAHGALESGWREAKRLAGYYESEN